jgi:hypothetical protein
MISIPIGGCLPARRKEPQGSGKFAGVDTVEARLKRIFYSVGGAIMTATNASFSASDLIASCFVN